MTDKIILGGGGAWLGFKLAGEVASVGLAHRPHIQKNGGNVKEPSHCSKRVGDVISSVMV